MRLKTTIAVGGLANRTKLDVFLLVLEDGFVMQLEAGVEVEGPIKTSPDLPVLN